MITDTNALDGSVTLSELGNDAKRMVSASDILRFASLSKGTRVEVLHPRWPTGRVIHKPEVQQAYWTALGQCAVHTLSKALTNKVSDQCDILLKPSRGVRLKVDVKQGELALLPEGKVVYYAADKASGALGAGAVRLELGVESGFEEASGAAVAVAPASSMQSASPWWFVEETRDISEANISEIRFKVSNVAGVDPVSVLPGTFSFMEKVLADDVHGTVVFVPVLVNKWALAAGTVLKRFVPPRQVEAKDPKAITVAHLAKKAKLS